MSHVQEAVRALHEQHNGPTRITEGRALWLSAAAGELVREVRR